MAVDVGRVEAGHVEVGDVTKQYRTGRGVNGASFAVAPGTVVALLGPNGAGKTTIVRCIMGLLIPDRGHITIGGSPAGSDAAKRALAFLPDDPSLYPALSVEEHLRFRGLAFGTGADLDRRVQDAMDTVGIGHLADESAGELSRGQRQRVMIAAALVQEAVAYVLDEPTVGLDPSALDWIERWIRRVAVGGATVLVASHHLDFVGRIADRAVLMLEGAVADEFTVPHQPQLLEGWRKQISARYGGELDVV